MSKKKDKDAIAKLWKFLEGEVNDKELQRRYDGFKEQEKHLVDKHNELVKPINDAGSAKAKLESIIVESAKMGILATDAVAKLAEAEAVLAEKVPAIRKAADELEKERDLIKKYKEGTESKLFHYWCMLKSVDETVEPWIQFKEKEMFRNKIF